MRTIEQYYAWRFALVPIASAIRIRAVDDKHSVGYRDWYLFGIRLLRFQLMPR